MRCRFDLGILVVLPDANAERSGFFRHVDFLQGMLRVTDQVDLAIFVFVPLGPAYFPNFILGRPEELLAGALFCAALVGYATKLALIIAADEDHVCIQIRDNGVGIEHQNLTKVFTHGFTTRKEGHGFGLHCSALTARELGGSLSVQSDGIGQGTTFTLRLPLKKETAGA